MGRRNPNTKDTNQKVASSTVVKALHVLEQLAALCDTSPQGASVSEIAKLSGESPSSVCKHLAAFQQSGLVEQDEHSERYRIGLYSLRLASLALKTMNIREIASPYLRKLADLAGETVHLVVRDGLRVVYIDKVESSKTIRMHSQIGLRNPMYCTGVGKAILAFSPSSLTDAVIAEGLIPFTPYTLATQGTLVADLELIKARGFSIDNCEHEPEVRCVAAPIFNHLKEPVASISISAPKWRMSEERIETSGVWIRDTALDISNRLGYIR
ncbi:IclR family transcriptional regulator [Paenibacillus radicis (ex Xue et al. 2023)]|uniref:IclR family transcriptional regulator n=1 Tax=Paenibacillus radicis (ex Xue et al. 2023) TaxID=2972489 RepID=A0ABT1YE92_9BACL|nr:IclR family transcriptional regulator [Paenibacillus radicis (ex Xue et al. 2023)]MCR8631510.1 IclR family transcriptional regulator [Paenibacillus radicis (ex Xue et al. 2023)]